MYVCMYVRIHVDSRDTVRLAILYQYFVYVFYLPYHNIYPVQDGSLGQLLNMDMDVSHP